MKIKPAGLLLILLLFQVWGYSQDANISANKRSGSLKKFEKFTDTLLGPNVFIFNPEMDMKEIQEVIDTVFKLQTAPGAEFTVNRFAFLLKPGRYDLDVKVDYYTQVLGLGKSPEEVIINGAVRSNTTHGNSVLTNFWRAVENVTIVPAVNSTMIWGVSQAAPLRRVHIKGNLQLFDKGYASGGFLADSKVDGTVTSGPQQQWLTRNSEWQKWEGGNWNMMFIGVPQAPQGEWPEKPYTRLDETPIIREKPFLAWEGKQLNIKIPGIKVNSKGPGWTSGEKYERILSRNEIYIVRADKDNSASINSALKKGKNLLITPGRYFLDESLKITSPGTLVMGMGLATLIPTKGNAVVDISDTDNVLICGLTIDAGSVFSPVLFTVGETGSSRDHSKKPVFLYDIFFRVGGPAQGSAKTCLVVNSNDVIMDHLWLWRADHGNGVGWDKNKCANGIIVNGRNAIVYGLFNEHFQEYQTLWNGENGKVYFYQSELPYDPPSADSWKHNNVYGFASYKVADNVKSHEAWGVGIYNVFYNAPVIVDNAIETPPAIEANMHHLIIFWLNGNKESVVRSIINGKGGEVSAVKRKAIM
jgi:hypothetical protein